jgi:hypothetical protein
MEIYMGEMRAEICQSCCQNLNVLMLLQEREAAMLMSHKVQQQPIEDCLATLGALLAGPRERVPPVTTVFAQPVHVGVQATRNKQVFHSIGRLMV